MTALGGLQKEMMELRAAVSRLEAQTPSDAFEVEAAAVSDAHPAGVGR